MPRDNKRMTFTIVFVGFFHYCYVGRHGVAVLLHKLHSLWVRDELEHDVVKMVQLQKLLFSSIIIE